LGIYINLSIWYKLSDQTRYGLYISGVGAILTVVMNILFIPSYGYIASAWISFAAYTSMMILSYILGQKNYPIPYHLRKNLAYIFAAILMVILSFHIFERNLIIGNSLLVFFLLIIFLVERKALKALINENSSNQ
jgi:O-antigen/teichoic acid export membrane protein